MDLYYIDHISVYGRSWLHRVSVPIKMGLLALIIGLLLWEKSVYWLAGAGVAILIVAATARLPMRLFLGLTFYPLLFLIIIFISMSGVTLLAMLSFALRVLAITGFVVTFFLTSSFPAIFCTMGRFLPGFLVSALFFTYRSIFIISDSLNNIQTAMHLRGGLDWRRPTFTLTRLGTALGHFLVHSIESSENIADSLRLRGFSGRIYYLGGKDER